MSDPRFGQCVELLLAQQIICPVEHKLLFDYLDDDRNRLQVREYLAPLNRDIRHTSDREAFLCAYKDVTDPTSKSECKAYFRHIALDIQPLVQWLCLVMDLRPTGRPLRTGDKLSKAELLTRIEGSPVFAERLADLARQKLFGSKSQEPQGQLQQICSKLTDLGYLKPIGHSGITFLATGKWSVLYDQLGFIKSYEKLEEPEDDGQGILIDVG